MVDHLHDFIKNQDWQGAMMRLRTHPTEASHHDDAFRFPLHHALTNISDHFDTPMMENEDKKLLCKQLIMANPSAVWQEDEYGWTPVHISCAHANSVEIISLLLEVCNVACTIPTPCGLTPLYLATWRRGTSIEVLKVLLTVAPNCVQWPSLKGETPLTVLWNDFLIKYSERQTSTMAMCPTDMEIEDKIKLELYLKASHHGTISNALPCNRKWRILHAAAASVLTPPSLFYYVMNAVRHEIKEKDEYGRLPLVLAVNAKVYKEEYEISCEDANENEAIDTYDDESNSMDDNNSVSAAQVTAPYPSIIRQLIQEYPEAASIPDPNNRLPLSLVIGSALVSQDINKTWENGIRDIVHAAPQALHTRDLVLNMYPFMYAACAGDKTRRNINNDPSMQKRLSCQRLDLIYNLLREGPHIADKLLLMNQRRMMQ